MVLNKEVFAHPDNREVVITEGLVDLTTPLHIGEVRQDVDGRYSQNRAGFLRSLSNSQRSHPIEGNGHNLSYGFHYDETTAGANRLTIAFSPLNDCAPAAHYSKLIDYVSKDAAKLTKDDREATQPNSWRQAIKTRDIHDTLAASGYGQPVIAIYNPIPEMLFNEADKTALRNGITTPFGKAAVMAAQYAERELGKKFQQIDIYAPGMGHNAIGAAHFLKHFSEYQPDSLTLPNLIMDLGSKSALLARYTPLKDTYQQAGLFDLDGPKLPEAMLSKEADALGSEKAMRKRQIRAIYEMSKAGQAAAMLDSGWTRQALDELLDGGIQVTVPLAYNARITEGTRKGAPEHPGLELIDIKSAAQNKNIGLITNEFVTLGSVLALRGLRRALD